jgi:hypothetical protein
VLALYSPSGFIKVFADARGGLFVMIYKASNGSIIVYKSRGQLGASSICLWRAYKGICKCRREVRGSQVPALFP